MKPPTILSVAFAAISLLLSVWLFVASGTNQGLQGELQKKQDEIQTQSQQVQLQQQQLQAQQEQINAGVQLAQQIGPAVLKDLGAIAIQNKNEKIKKVLSKYGVTINEQAAKPAASPAPAPANQ